MKKLHLDASTLRVESFESASEPPLRATVRAAESWSDSIEPDCPRTDWMSCPATCADEPSCRPASCP